MYSADEIAALFGLAVASCFSPGPNNLMMMASGTNFGYRRTLPHVAGVLLGFNVMMTLVGVGLWQLLVAMPAAFLGLKVVCAAYLVYLAFRLAMTRGSLDITGGASKPLTFTQAALFQWINPKAWTMVVAANSVFVPVEAPVVGLLVVSLVFFLTGIVSTSTWTYAGTRIRALLNTPQRLRVFNTTAALLLLTSLYPMFTSKLSL